MTQFIGSDKTFPVQYGYDNTTRRLNSITYPDGFQVSYQYGSDGNLQYVRDASNNLYASLTGYDALGRPASVGYGNQGTMTYTYDPLSFRLSRLTSSAATGHFDVTYSYDPAGNLLSAQDALPTTPSHSQSFGYDALNRLVSAQSQAYAPDALPPSGITYQYDQQRVHVLKSTFDGAHYALYDHDDNGNRKTDPLRTLNWSADNLPTSITMSGATTTFTYDGTGARVKKVGPAETVFYAGNLYECSGTTGTTCIRYIYAAGMRIAASRTGDLSYFHADHLGSTRAVTDNHQPGQQIENIFYQPYGRIESDDAPSKSRYKYTGQEWDAETGLYNYGARLYDPALGRFASGDSIIPNLFAPQSLNRYSYAGNNPIGFLDPSGHSPVRGGRGRADGCDPNDPHCVSAPHPGTGPASPSGGCAGICGDVGDFFSGLWNKILKPVGGWLWNHPLIVTGAIDPLGIGTLEGAMSAGSAIGNGIGSATGGDVGRAGSRGDAMQVVASGAIVTNSWWLANELSLEDLLSGGGRMFAEARDAARIATEYGAEAADIAKVTSRAFTNGRGGLFDLWEIHAFKNGRTGELYELKTKFPRMENLIQRAGGVEKYLRMTGAWTGRALGTLPSLPLFMVDPSVANPFPGFMSGCQSDARLCSQ